MSRLKKSILVGKIKFFFTIIILFLFLQNVKSEDSILEGKYLVIKVLDKVSSKSYELKIKIAEEKVFKNISITAIKCKNSEFDDNTEITEYLQVKDLKSSNNDEVFVING